MTLDELIQKVDDNIKKVEDNWQTFRRHKHRGQALDQSEEISLGTAPGSSPSPSVSPSGALESPGEIFVSRTTLSGSSDITIPDLDLATDKCYRVTIACRNVLGGGIIYWINNNDSGAGKHHWITTGYHATGGIQNANSEGDTKWSLSESGGSKSQLIELTLHYNSNNPFANWKMTGNGYSGDDTLRMCTATGGGNWVSGTNITSFYLQHNSGTNCDWDVIVTKVSLV